MRSWTAVTALVVIFVVSVFDRNEPAFFVPKTTGWLDVLPSKSHPPFFTVHVSETDRSHYPKLTRSTAPSIVRDIDEDRTASYSMKADFLAVYDYGTGGVWVILHAQTKQEISAKYPELTVVDERPSWMTADLHEKIAEKLWFDIDDEPTGWLLELVNQRSKL